MRDLIPLLSELARSRAIVLEPPPAMNHAASLPAGLRDLAAFASGLQLRDRPESALHWTRGLPADYLQYSPEVLGTDIGTDECGNAWILLFDSEHQPTQVIWACHDPGLLVAAHDTLAGFIREWTASPDSLARRVASDSRASTAGLPREAALRSPDLAIREFAAGLDDQRWIIHDLRSGSRSFEHDWRGTLRKHPRALLFANIGDGV